MPNIIALFQGQDFLSSEILVFEKVNAHIINFVFFALLLIAETVCSRRKWNFVTMIVHIKLSGIVLCEIHKIIFSLISVLKFSIH